MNLLNEYNNELAARLETQTSMSLRQAASLMQNPEVVMHRLEDVLDRFIRL
jgi:hypothetical protein